VRDTANEIKRSAREVLDSLPVSDDY
jgi:hypothetical protein